MPRATLAKRFASRDCTFRCGARPRAAAARPSVLFSHGFHGSSTQSSFLMQALAANGYLNRRSLDGLGVPVMFQGGTRDLGISPSLAKGGGAFVLTTGPAYYIEFLGAGHFAWTDLTQQSHASIVDYTVSFLDRYVRGDRRADPGRRLHDVSTVRVK